MKKALFWHRRDLRFHDNAGLYRALKENESVQSVFVFDKTILDKLPTNDQRILFIHKAIQELKSVYQNFGSDLKVIYGNPVIEIPKLAAELDVSTVYTNRDYEPYAQQRDKEVFDTLKNQNIDFIGAKDHVIFEKAEVVKPDGLPYTIFTPYSRKWKEKLTDFYLSSYPTEKYAAHLRISKNPFDLPNLKEMGFEETELHPIPAPKYASKFMANYSISRDFPAVEKGTSHLGVHLRFGTISIRELARQAAQTNETFLNELIWRDFYQAILFHFPHSVTGSFKKQYDAILWRNNETEFQAWCEGKTGYPLVDAGMRELNATGYMHNRVRMVVASFLTKHLLIDWKWGETYFAEKLLDFDLASNIGGWQWASGSGCDAAPYFRVFNPTAQLEKFDKELKYVKKWVPEYGTAAYAPPIVEHKMARERVLAVYKEALN
ncbi:MAG: deoxyribodipyrimidine photo-lyase [Crocinitomicaceae bacterium]